MKATVEKSGDHMELHQGHIGLSNEHFHVELTRDDLAALQIDNTKEEITKILKVIVNRK